MFWDHNVGGTSNIMLVTNSSRLSLTAVMQATCYKYSAYSEDQKKNRSYVVVGKKMKARSDDAFKGFI